MERTRKQEERFRRICSFYWRGNPAQAVVVRLGGAHCLFGSTVSDGRPVMKKYMSGDTEALSDGLLKVGVPQVRVISYRNDLGFLDSPDALLVLADMKTDFQKQKRKKKTWHKTNKRGFRE